MSATPLLNDVARKHMYGGRLTSGLRMRTLDRPVLSRNAKQDITPQTPSGLEGRYMNAVHHKTIRGKGLFEDIGNVFKKGVDAVKNVGEKAVDAVKDVGEKAIETAVDTVGEVFEPVGKFIGTRKGLTAISQKTLKDFGEAKVNVMYIARAPVGELLVNALNVVSLGKFKKELKKKPYDSLFHLSIIMETDKGNVRVEKNDTVNITPKPVKQKGEERVFLKVPEGITLGEMIEKTKLKMGKNFLPYDPMRNNCQRFIMSVLEANGMETKENKEFVVQDSDDLFNPLLRKVGRTLTDIGATTKGGMMNQPNYDSPDEADVIHPLGGANTNRLIRILGSTLNNINHHTFTRFIQSLPFPINQTNLRNQLSQMYSPNQVNNIMNELMIWNAYVPVVGVQDSDDEEMEGNSNVPVVGGMINQPIIPLRDEEGFFDIKYLIIHHLGDIRRAVPDRQELREILELRNIPDFMERLELRVREEHPDNPQQAQRFMRDFERLMREVSNAYGGEVNKPPSRNQSAGGSIN